MSKPRRIPKDSEAHLQQLGVHHKSFEFYDGPAFEVRGLKDSDYRWKVTDKRSTQVKFCCSLAEAVQFIEKACLEQKAKQ